MGDSSRLSLPIAALVSCVSTLAFAQGGSSEIVAAAARLAGFTDCEPDIQRPMGDPTGGLLLDYEALGDKAVLPTFRICRNASGQAEIWRVLPYPGGLGINEERLNIAEYREQWGTALMWIVPHKAYKPHDNYWPGKTNQSGAKFEPINHPVLWENMPVTMPFIPQKVVYFGDAFGVASVGFTQLVPIPGLEKEMYPLRYDSVVFGVSGATFSTSQNYILSFNFDIAYSELLELAYYESYSSVGDVQSMNESARVAYLPVFEVSQHQEAYRALTGLVGASGMQLGSIAEWGRVLEPFDTFLNVLEGIGWDEAEYQRQCQEIKDAGGLCFR